MYVPEKKFDVLIRGVPISVYSYCSKPEIILVSQILQDPTQELSVNWGYSISG